MRLPGRASDDARFQLERFEWAAPDRLEITGSFAGMAAPSAPPTLAIQGADGVRRLTGATEASDDGNWTVAFLWREPPIPFEAATLEFSDGLSVALPAPGESSEPLSISHGASVPAADTLRLQAELVAAQAEASEAQAAHDRLSEELARARADLEAEQSRRADDSNRFKQGLAQVRDAGEQALAATQAELTALRARIADLEGQLGELPSLQADLGRMASEADERRETIERAEAEQRALREALGRAQAQAEESQAALERAQAEAVDAEHLRARLTAVRQALENDP